jgi:hypothetical protein
MLSRKLIAFFLNPVSHEIILAIIFLLAIVFAINVFIIGGARKAGIVYRQELSVHQELEREALAEYLLDKICKRIKCETIDTHTDLEAK